MQGADESPWSVGSSGDTDSTYVNEGCVHIVCVLLTPLNWNDHSVELICRKESRLWFFNITCPLLPLLPSFPPTPGSGQIYPSWAITCLFSDQEGESLWLSCYFIFEAIKELRATRGNAIILVSKLIIN